MDERERKARQKFFAETGKTPEEEARASASGLGILLIFFVLALSAFLGWLKRTLGY